MTSQAALKKTLVQMLQDAGFFYADCVYDQLTRYLLLLNQWNRVTNLTGIDNVQAMITTHILDSLSVAPFIQGKKVLDVGTGAGLPGVPLALALTDREFVLLDSNNKKTSFLIHVKQCLAIPNILIVHARVETFKTEVGFDTVISRAFTSLSNFLSKTAHLLSGTGCWLAMKGKYPASELEAIRQDLFAVDVIQLKVAGLNAERHVVVVRACS